MKVTHTTFRMIRGCVIAYVEFAQTLPRLRDSKSVFSNVKNARMLESGVNNFICLCCSSYLEQKRIVGRQGVVSGREKNNQEKKGVGGEDREGQGTSYTPSSGKWKRDHQKCNLLDV